MYYVLYVLLFGSVSCKLLHVANVHKNE